MRGLIELIFDFDFDPLNNALLFLLTLLSKSWREKLQVLLDRGKNIINMINIINKVKLV